MDSPSSFDRHLSASDSTVSSPPDPTTPPADAYPMSYPSYNPSSQEPAIADNSTPPATNPYSLNPQHIPPLHHATTTHSLNSSASNTPPKLLAIPHPPDYHPYNSQDLSSGSFVENPLPYHEDDGPPPLEKAPLEIAGNYWHQTQLHPPAQAPVGPSLVIPPPRRTSSFMDDLYTPSDDHLTIHQRPSPIMLGTHSVSPDLAPASRAGSGGPPNSLPRISTQFGHSPSPPALSTSTLNGPFISQSSQSSYAPYHPLRRYSSPLVTGRDDAIHHPNGNLPIPTGYSHEVNGVHGGSGSGSGGFQFRTPHGPVVSSNPSYMPDPPASPVMGGGGDRAFPSAGRQLPQLQTATTHHPPPHHPRSHSHSLPHTTIQHTYPSPPTSAPPTLADSRYAYRSHSLPTPNAMDLPPALHPSSSTLHSERFHSDGRFGAPPPLMADARYPETRYTDSRYGSGPPPLASADGRYISSDATGLPGLGLSTVGGEGRSPPGWSAPSGPIVHTDDAASKETANLRRKCFNCATTEPPSWRRSTLTPGKIVCNRCGLYERTHLRPRPSGSGGELRKTSARVTTGGASGGANPYTLSPLNSKTGVPVRTSKKHGEVSPLSMPLPPPVTHGYEQGQQMPQEDAKGVRMLPSPPMGGLNVSPTSYSAPATGGEMALRPIAPAQ